MPVVTIKHLIFLNFLQAKVILEGAATKCFGWDSEWFAKQLKEAIVSRAAKVELSIMFDSFCVCKSLPPPSHTPFGIKIFYIYIFVRRFILSDLRPTIP